jgi:hypothetical protein
MYDGLCWADVATKEFVFLVVIRRVESCPQR